MNKTRRWKRSPSYRLRQLARIRAAEWIANRRRMWFVAGGNWMESQRLAEDDWIRLHGGAR